MKESELNDALTKKIAASMFGAGGVDLRRLLQVLLEVVRVVIEGPQTKAEAEILIKEALSSEIAPTSADFERMYQLVKLAVATQEPPSRPPLDELYGAWSGADSAADLIRNIRESRNFNRQSPEL